MLCYRDRTFCPFHETCKHGRECDRALTEDIELRAAACNLWISKYVDKPGCWEQD